jgi:hypothetical protein
MEPHQAITLLHTIRPSVRGLRIDKLTSSAHGRPPFVILFHGSARFRLGLVITGVYRYHPTKLLGVRPANRRSTKRIADPARTLRTLAIRDSLPSVSVNTFTHTWTERQPKIQCPIQACRVDERIWAGLLAETGTEALCDYRAISSSNGDHGEGGCIPCR